MEGKVKLEATRNKNFQLKKTLLKRVLKAHDKYEEKLVNNTTDGNKKLWAFIRNSPIYIILVRLKTNGGLTQSDPKSKTEVLNKQLKSVNPMDQID